MRISSNLMHPRKTPIDLETGLDNNDNLRTLLEIVSLRKDLKMSATFETTQPEWRNGGIKICSGTRRVKPYKSRLHCF